MHPSRKTLGISESSGWTSSVKSKVLESSALARNIRPAICLLCDLGWVTNLSVVRFSHQYNRNDNIPTSQSC